MPRRCRIYGGPARSRGTTGAVCGPTSTHDPVTDEQARCGVGVQLQPAIDAARRIVHEQALRPYRVFLVWQERDYQRVWQTVKELELLPVKVTGMHQVELVVTPAGTLPTGPVKLRQISPQQVGEETLRGWLDGEEWLGSNPDREFFYEVRLHKRCDGDPEPRRQRFQVSGEPELNAKGFEWIVRLVDSMPARDRAGEDATVGPDVEPGQVGARLVL